MMMKISNCPLKSYAMGCCNVPHSWPYFYLFNEQQLGSAVLEMELCDKIIKGLTILLYKL